MSAEPAGCALRWTTPAHGGVYMVASLAWLWAVEGVRPDRADVAGAALCLLGAAVILFGRSVLRVP